MRGTAITGAAVAFVVQSAALTVGAFWAGWRLHQWAAGLAATVPTVQPSSPTLRVVGDADEVSR